MLLTLPPIHVRPSQEGRTLGSRPMQQQHSVHRLPAPSPVLRSSPPPLPTFTTRMYPSGGRRLISFFSCRTARTRSMTLLYTVSSVRSRLAVGAGWMD